MSRPNELKKLQVIVAATNDFYLESNILHTTIEELNHHVAAGYGIRLEGSRYETHTYPISLGEASPDIIETILYLSSCDIFVGIFWKRVANSHTAEQSKIRRFIFQIYRALFNNPQGVLYLNYRIYPNETYKENDQEKKDYTQLDMFYREERWLPYKKKSQFENLVREQFSQLIHYYGSFYDGTSTIDAPSPSGEFVVAALTKVLQNRDFNVRRRVFDALSHISEKQAVLVLQTALRDESPQLRRLAANTLGRVGGEGAVAVLLSALKDEDPYVRGGAIDALGQIGGEQAVAALAIALKDQDLYARQRILDALSRIGGERAVALIEKIEDIGREKTLGETSAYIAHEVRSVLGPLRIVADLLGEMLKQPNFDENELTAYIQRILKHTKVAYEVTDRYVDYTKPLIPVPDEVDINSLLVECIEEVATECKYRKIQVVRQLGQTPRANIDSKLIQEVFRNVILNAIEAINADGEITVTTYSERSIIIIKISDTGPGIKDEDLGQVFNLGFTTKLDKHGAGIGLALARRFVEEAHNGQIRIENNPHGQGALLTIELPKVER